MGLSDDQRAMLRLLAQREQGYEDIAALMGLSVDQVRARVKDALDQLEAEGKQPPAVPEPQPEPPSPEAEAPAPAAPEPPDTEEVPVPPEPESEPAVTPPPPPSPAEPAAAATPRRASGGGAPRLKLPRDPGARIAIAAGAVVLVALVVVLIVSGGGGASSTSTNSSGASGSEAAEGSTTTGSAKELTKAELKPVAGGEGSGEAVFGRYKEKLALQVTADGLKPTTAGTAYTVWIARSPHKMLPLASAKADKKGRIRAEFEIPTEVLAYLANETFHNIVISRTSTPLLEAALTKATKEEKPPIYTGTPVLEGEITGPIVGVAKKEQEKKKE